MAHEPTQDGRTSNRGFASMNQERQRQIASMGGKAVPDEKRSFSQNRRLAAEAGRKGGQSVPGSKRSFSQNRELAAVAGRKGGQSVPDEKRSFSQNPELAAEAGRKGGQASHGGGGDTHHREATEHKRSPGESEE
jgi:general stress protein YciG